jgi:hypothetical protein
MSKIADSEPLSKTGEIEGLPYNTRVMTDMGPIKIGYLAVAFHKKAPMPFVKALNEQTNQFEYKEILKVNRTQTTIEVIDFICRNGARSKQIIRCTDDQRVLTKRYGWKKACEINFNYKILGWKSTENNAVFYTVSEIERIKNTQPLFNLELENSNNYLISYFKNWSSALVVGSVQCQK